MVAAASAAEGQGKGKIQGHFFVGYSPCVEGYDPWIDSREARKEYGLEVLKQPDRGRYDAIILGRGPLDPFKAPGVSGIRRYGHPGAVLYDVKHLFAADQVDGRL